MSHKKGGFVYLVRSVPNGPNLPGGEQHAKNFQHAGDHRLLWLAAFQENLRNKTKKQPPRNGGFDIEGRTMAPGSLRP